MTAKDFIKISESKLTTEKMVAEKLPLSERIKIESPGRPVPADILETQKETGKQKKAKEKPVKKDSVFIITEKPKSAQKIAFALGKPNKYLESGVAYYEVERDGKNVLIASAVGHLFNLTHKKGQRGWPIFDLEWEPSYTEKHSAFTKRYFDAIKTLSKRAKSFVVATDYDIEGEVIGWNILRFLCGQKTAKRMKFSTLTTEELKNAYEKPEPHLNWGNAHAGESRHILDWLYGINLSRALMNAIKTTGSFKILSIGRVQGPALKIIVDKEKEINSFKSEPYWQVIAYSNKLPFKHPKDIFNKKELKKFENIKEAEANTKKSEEHILPETPFDLTTLQREAYRVYKMTPSETLQIAQKLYLEGLISYPRTSSQKIPKEIEPKKILKALEKHFPEAKKTTRTAPMEGDKTDPAHPSIYPTGEFAGLTGRDEKLYSLIAKRFIACFSQDAITSNKHITLTAQTKEGIVNFTASGLVILERGWTAFYPVALNENELPDMSGKVKIDKIEFEEKETRPPNRYSPTSLVSLLEKKNLGTKATRSIIVDTLFERGYLDGKSIQATPLGMKLISSLEKHSPIIIDENLTIKLEEEMEEIQNSKEDLEKKEQNIINKAKKIIEDISKEFKSKEAEIGKELAEGLKELRQEQQEANALQQCPACKKGNLRIMYNRASRRYFVACSAYPNCKQTYSLPPNALIKKVENDKFCEADKFPKLLAIRRAKRPWEFCFNPECPIEKAKREEWEAKKSDN